MCLLTRSFTSRGASDHGPERLDLFGGRKHAVLLPTALNRSRQGGLSFSLDIGLISVFLLNIRAGSSQPVWLGRARSRRQLLLGRVREGTSADAAERPRMVKAHWGPEDVHIRTI